jgi:hypothetical protein
MEIVETGKQYNNNNNNNNNNRMLETVEVM